VHNGGGLGATRYTTTPLPTNAALAKFWATDTHIVNQHVYTRSRTIDRRQYYDVPND